MSNFGGGGARDPDSYYVQDCRQVQTNTHGIQTLTGQISRQIGQLSSDKDVLHCRGMVDDAVRQASETQATLARIREHQAQAQNPGERNNRRMMYQKLSDNLAVTAHVLEDVVRRFHQEESRRRRPQIESDVAAGGEHIPLVDTGASLEPQKLHVGVTALDEEIEQQQHQTLRRVDEDMRCLQKIYTDLATTAHDQESSFESLEATMAGAAMDIERGREQIHIYSKYAWGHQLKKKMVVWGAGGLAVLGLLAYLTSG